MVGEEELGTSGLGKKDGKNIAAPIYKLAIEIIFGVIIGVSFIGYHKELVPFAFNFETAMIITAYITVLASLVGYMITLLTREHKYVYRFVIDLVLVFLYFQLIYSPKHDFELFLSIFPWIFGLYLIWQAFEYYEYKNAPNYSGFKRKVVYSGPIFAISLVVWIYYVFVYAEKAINVAAEGTAISYENVTSVEWVLLGIILGTVLGFRIYPWVKRSLRK